MHRPALVLLALLSTACGPKRPAITQELTDYFPLVDGASWTYQGTFGEHSSMETRYAVADTVGGQPAWVFLLEQDLGDDSAVDTFTTMIGLGVYRRTASGLTTADNTWREDLEDRTLADFQPMLDLPPVVGQSVTPSTSSVDRSGGWTVEAIEDLTVPAGTFEDCARLGLGQGSLAWLCPGVGLAKWVFVTGRVEELTEWKIPGGRSGP